MQEQPKVALPQEAANYSQELTNIFSSTLEKSMTKALPPYLHSFAPRTHVLAQEKIIQCYSSDDVEHLLDNLFDQLWIHSMLTHHGMERVQLSNNGVQSVGSFISNAGCSLPQPCRFHPWDTLDSLMLQHSRNCVRLTTFEWLQIVYVQACCANQKNPVGYLHRKITLGFLLNTTMTCSNSFRVLLRFAKSKLTAF